MIIPQELQKLIDDGESMTVEFKESHTDITKDVYETVCSFSNRDGGHIFLGLKNNGKIIGVQEDRVDKICKQFVTTINNGNKMYPPLYLNPVIYQADGKQIIYIRVPASQEVVRCSGKIWNRNGDADIDITNHSDEVYRLYSRKNGSYFVNKVTGFGMDSLRSDLIERARRMTRVRGENHPWKSMSDEELLRSAGLILPDETAQRNGILREIISNLLMHRDFSSGYVAKIVIERSRIFTENANLSHGYGVLQLANFDPFQKNPPISKVFREIGLADELGSGMRNTYKYTKMYSGAEPEFIEGDVFRIIVPLSNIATTTVGPALSPSTTQVTTQVDTQVKLKKELLDALVDYCSTPKSRKEMQNFCNIKTTEYFRKYIIKPMLANGLIRPTIPDKPTSKNQKYVKNQVNTDY